jgi:hypothetical protein
MLWPINHSQVKMEILVVIANKTNFLEIVDELAAYAMPCHAMPCHAMPCHAPVRPQA